MNQNARARERENARVWDALREVMAPEFPISLVDLGLIYDVRRRDRVVEIDFTFTATACPCMDFIHEDIRERLLKEADIGSEDQSNLGAAMDGGPDQRRRKAEAKEMRCHRITRLITIALIADYGL